MKKTVRLTESQVRRIVTESVMRILSEGEQVGTIIHGTMRSQDLIPAFMKVVERNDSAKAEELYDEYPELKGAIEDEASGVDNEWFESEDADWLLNEVLFDLLDSYSPDGCYFGANEGDGSDYGYWPEYED